MKFDTYHLQQALDSLYTAFDWADSPQGHSYWANVRLNLCTVSDNALDVTDEFATYCEPPNVELCREFAHHLNEAFIWPDSPQKASYWAKVVVEIANIIAMRQEALKPSKPKDDWDRAMKGIG